MRGVYIFYFRRDFFFYKREYWLTGWRPYYFYFPVYVSFFLNKLPYLFPLLVIRAQSILILNDVTQGNSTFGNFSFGDFALINLTLGNPCTTVWLQQTVRSSCWSSMLNGAWPEPTNKRFISAYLQIKYLIFRNIHSNTF